jgi:hypothetical protein
MYIFEFSLYKAGEKGSELEPHYLPRPEPEPRLNNAVPLDYGELKKIVK